MRYITAAFIALPFYLLSCKDGSNDTMTIVVLAILLASTFLFATTEE